MKVNGAVVSLNEEEHLVTTNVDPNYANDWTHGYADTVVATNGGGGSDKKSKKKRRRRRRH
jgi:hypothetical protein